VEPDLVRVRIRVRAKVRVTLTLTLTLVLTRYATKIRVAANSALAEEETLRSPVSMRAP
jgi:hypothetical protein